MAGLALASWLGVALTGSELMLRLAYVLSAALLLSAGIAWTSVGGVHLQRRTLSQRSQVGLWAEEWLRLTNRSWLPKLWLEVRDDGDLPCHRVSRVIAGLLPGRSETWFVRTRLRRRGIFRLGPMTVAGGDPLGMFQRRHHLPDQVAFTVYPAVVALPGIEMPTGYLSGGQIVRRRAEYTTTNIRGVRPYQPGDAFSRIHWPTTARRSRLYTKEFELDPVADYWIVVDLDREVHIGEETPQDTAPRAELEWLRPDRATVEPTTEEYAVTISASLAHRAIESGKSAGLIAYGQRRLVITPDRGERQRTKLLECLAAIRAVGHLRLDEVLALESHQFTRHTTVFVITPTTDSRWVQGLRELRFRGVESIAVWIDPATFAAELDGQAVRAALSAYGIPHYAVARDELGTVGLPTATAWRERRLSVGIRPFAQRHRPFHQPT